MREDDAVGGAKLQLHCARQHLFRKENSSANNKRQTDAAFISVHDFIALPLRRSQTEITDGIKTLTVRREAHSAPNMPTSGRRNQ